MLVDVKKACDILGLSYATVLNMIKRNMFIGVTTKGGFVGHPIYMIPLEEVERVKKERYDAKWNRNASEPVVVKTVDLDELKAQIDRELEIIGEAYKRLLVLRHELDS